MAVAKTLKSFYKGIPRRWRTPKTLLTLFVLELLITIAALALYGIAVPDLYRTKLWQEGSDHGWNSNPNEILYAYANHRPIKYPTPWASSYVWGNISICGNELILLEQHHPIQRRHRHSVHIPSPGQRNHVHYPRL